MAFHQVLNLKSIISLPSKMGHNVQGVWRDLQSSTNFVITKLFTKEDPVYLHKILGLLALISFYYRYALLRVPGGGLGFGVANWTWFDAITIGLHLALSFSSIIFHVLRHRILTKPLIIYEEYRLHAMVFTMRCASVWFFAVFVRPALLDVAATMPATGPLRLVADNMVHFLLFALVMAHHLVADYITEVFGSKEHTAVRVTGKEPLPLWQIMGQRYYSFYQFMAVASHIYGCDRLADMGFNTLIAIQSSAFLMTLFRKGVIHGFVHAALYTSCLFVSEYHMYLAHQSVFLPFIALALGAFALRSQLNVNKYAIWFLFSMATSPLFASHIKPMFV